MTTPERENNEWHSPALVGRVAQVCLKNSEYEFVRGGRGEDFVDVDEFYGDHRHLGAERALDALVERISAINDRSPLRAVVFIERDSGPVGMIAARHRFAEKIDVPFLTLRPRKRIRRASIKGGQLRVGDSVVIVTDVSTTGGTIGEAVRRIVELGGKVVAAVSFIDREIGAKVALEQMDIPLESVYTVGELQDAGAGSRHDKD